jgi:hypothetical protein
MSFRFENRQGIDFYRLHLRPHAARIQYNDTDGHSDYLVRPPPSGADFCFANVLHGHFLPRLLSQTRINGSLPLYTDYIFARELVGESKMFVYQVW